MNSFHLPLMYQIPENVYFQAISSISLSAWLILWYCTILMKLTVGCLTILQGLPLSTSPTICLESMCNKSVYVHVYYSPSKFQNLTINIFIRIVIKTTSSFKNNWHIHNISYILKTWPLHSFKLSFIWHKYFLLTAGNSISFSLYHLLGNWFIEIFLSFI